jgi:hypothetical protein
MVAGGIFCLAMLLDLLLCISLIMHFISLVGIVTLGRVHFMYLLPFFDNAFRFFSRHNNFRHTYSNVSTHLIKIL